ncbi:T9SS type A sorting domain-containing protein [Hymenobacter tibetensis]|uniref:T9SS type A sorting domain-containing protein n=1 Tax=Hymenobacter tibetensis TaxID=497967 RepID=A0ABY4D140_9BACT|nr:T9SS type A sorting domain-containing protein [Hymenobacter tibetensis]UOG75762.1 T9SS type A sorting domain-containing protein [Hymenobacter tibetensis]
MKHFLLFASLLGSTLTTFAQAPLPERTLRNTPTNPALAPIEALLKRNEAARPTTTVRQASRISTYLWNRTTSQWGSGSIATYTYDAQGRTIGVVRTDSATQVPSTRTTYTYNATGQLSRYLDETWQGSAWQNFNQELFTYDGQNRRTEYLNQNWINGAWQNSYRDQYTYNAQGYFTQVLYQRWANNAWSTFGGQQYSYTFDTAGRMSEQQYTPWNTNLGTFVLEGRYLYTYTGTSTNYSSYDYQTWNANTNSWLSSSRYTFAYNTQGRISSYEAQLWNGTTWQPNLRTTYTYLASGQDYTSLTEQFLNGTWQNYTRYNNTYDLQGTYLGVIFEDWLNNTWVYVFGTRYTVGYNANNDLARRLTQNVDYTTSTLVNYEKSFYSDYQTITLGNKAKAQVAEMQLSPNPTSGKVTLALSGFQGSGEAQVVVSNTLGQTVQQVTVRPQAGILRQTLHLAGLPAGVYSVSVHTPTGIVTKKLLHE